MNCKENIRKKVYTLFMMCVFVLCFLASCTVERFIDDGDLYLKHVKVTSTEPQSTKQYPLADYVIQSPNSKWFSFKVPLSIYCLSGVDTTNWATRFFRKIGEEPVVYDSLKAQHTISDISQMLHNEGFLHAKAREEKKISGKKLSLTYVVDPGYRYWIHSIRRNVIDKAIAAIVCDSDTVNSLIREGMPFNINLLNEERNRITNILKNQGYYRFNKEYITYTADTVHGSNMVDITMEIDLHRDNGRSEPTFHPQYTINQVNYFVDTHGITDTLQLKKISAGSSNIYYSDRLRFRPSMLTTNTLFKSGDLYNEENQLTTYRNFTRMSGISGSNIKLEEIQDSVYNRKLLAANIILNHAPSKSISFDLEGTNSAGDLGVAASTSFRHKNLFKGSETFMLKLRGAYEAITGLKGYEGHNYIELGGEMSLGFPGLLLPFAHDIYSSANTTTSEIAIQYNMQNRPEFNRRVLTAAWRYRWNDINKKATHRFDLLEINYVNMPWISNTFKEQYLDSLGKTNAILKYNYENILITKMGYTYSYNSLGSSVTSTYGTNAYTVRFNIETSGNILDLATRMIGSSTRNENGQKAIADIAFAQYVKGDLDLAKSVRLDKNNSLGMHLGVGIAYPYGNTNILPFEKRYFAGGANSVRGWSVRTLGPGSYNGADNGINFINQSGDIKLDMSLEFRSHLFWKINGALFIDGGNIWTIRNYKDQPGGQFRFDTFLKEIAFAYGIGLRMNLDFFIIRFDGGMKAINPARKGKEHYPITHPNFDRDFAFHFAIGLPF